MASDSPGSYSRPHHVNDKLDCHVISGLLTDTNDTRGNFQMGVVSGFQRDTPFVVKDSGYYVSTSDGASTCSSSTTEAGEIEGGTLLVLEPKSLRSFTTNDEYLYAMKEDLADWFACLYQRDDLTAENFFQILETGVLLCKHANKVQEFARQRREMGETLEMRSYFIRSVPEGNVSFREGVKPETFQARDNVSNFISWGRQLGIPEVLSFETDDLVLRKNEKSVILCLLEIARVGAKLGMLAPTLIQMEQEIDAELAGEEPKPQIQIITCDMRSLDERVRDLIGRCICPIQFPMIKVGEGKYKIGDSRSLIFVRILRNHVMVRVGGGWDTLENYLNKHDPCQCNYRGHRPSAAAVAHKVVVSQQRQPATVSNAPARPIPNTPTSPRRGSSAGATRNRSTSPHSTSSTKTPTLVISRHMPAISKSSTASGTHAKGGRITSNHGQQGVVTEESSDPASSLSNQPARCNSPSPARRRSPSPRTTSQCLPQPVSARRSSLTSGQVKGKDLAQEKKILAARQDTAEPVNSDNEEDEIVDNDGYFTEDDECDNPHVRGGPANITPGLAVPAAQPLSAMYNIVEAVNKNATNLTPAWKTPAASFNNKQNGDSGESTSSLESPRRATPSYAHPARRALTEREFGSNAAFRSGSFDERANLHSSASGMELGREFDTTNSNECSSKTNVSMDKISTMTLAEFKSLLSSALSAPEEQKQGHSERFDRPTQEQCQGTDFRSSRPLKAVSTDAASSGPGAGRTVGMRGLSQTSDGDHEESAFWRPKTPTVLHRNTDVSTTADVSRPKTPTSISRSKTPKTAGDQERIAPKEEYKMARPKPASQIKKDAVAKVAGAISNWVDFRSEVSSADTVPSRPKTPVRPKTLIGSHTSMLQNLLHENDEGDDLEVSDTFPNLLMPSSLLNVARERPSTPSRIPKPCFIPRPKTPSSHMPESPTEVTSQLSFPSQQGTTPTNLTRLNITSSNRPIALSRSNSNSSSVKSVDETPISPASSFSEDRIFKIHTRARRLSNSSDSFNTNNNNVAANSNNNNAGRSYKDIYTAKRAATSGSDGRIPSTRAVTPGPREKWTLGGNSGSGSASEHTNPIPNSRRRGSINTTCQADKQTLPKAIIPASQIRRTSSASNIETEQQITITNEITFSDDEEIDELLKNAALRVKAQNVRSSSVNARKFAHQNAEENDEVLMIRRDPNVKGIVNCNSAAKFSIVRRPSSRGSSTDRASPATVASRLPHAPNTVTHWQKTVPAGKNKDPHETDSTITASEPGDKNLNRTEAWVDSTLSDNKRKPLPRPKRAKGFDSEIPANELASRPLEEIQAILTEPKNGFVQVDARALQPPPEDPEMFRKMEKLFEKYREMEMRASINETLGGGGGRSASIDKSGDVHSAKGQRSAHRAPKSVTSAASMKTSSGSSLATSGHLSGQTNIPQSSGRAFSNDDNRFARSSSTPRPFQNQQQRSSSSNSSALASTSQDNFSLNNTNHSDALSQNLKTSEHEYDHKGFDVLQDIDPEIAKNPAALISKIKEILKVRPRKDENTKGPTRIPAPAILHKYKRSKSVSNLYGDFMSNSDAHSGHDLNTSQPDDTGGLHSADTGSLYGDNGHDSHSFKKSNTLLSGKNASTDEADDATDELPELTRSWSVQSDSTDGQNRSETPAPKLATPLTTGRSTLISRKGDRLGRSLSQDKENMSNSQSTVLSQSVMSPTEDKAEFV